MQTIAMMTMMKTTAMRMMLFRSVMAIGRIMMVIMMIMLDVDCNDDCDDAFLR